MNKIKENYTFDPLYIVRHLFTMLPMTSPTIQEDPFESITFDSNCFAPL